MKKKLVILGNGFDIGHSLPSKYSDFFCFLKKNYSNDVNDFKYLEQWGEPPFDLWSDIESAITKLSSDLSAVSLITAHNLQLFIDSQNDYVLTKKFKNELEKVGLNSSSILKEFNKLSLISYGNLSFDLNILDFDYDYKQNTLNDNIDKYDLKFSDKERKIINQALKNDIRILEIIDFDYPNDLQLQINNFFSMIEEFEKLTIFIKGKLIYWANNMNDNIISQISSKSDLKNILANADILNFNYTDTVEILYTENNVQHIHGRSKIFNTKSKHWTEDEFEKFQIGGLINWEVFSYISIYAGYSLDYNDYPNRHQAEFFFEKLDKLTYQTEKKIQKIQFNDKYSQLIFIGISFNGVDRQYTEQLADLMTEETKICYYYYSKEDRINGIEFLNTLITIFNSTDDKEFDSVHNIEMLDYSNNPIFER